MMYRDYIESLKAEWIGKKVWYENRVYKVVNVDYNGAIHIDNPSQFTDTTAAYWPHEAKKHLACK